MCAPVLPILAAVGGAATVAQSLGIIGGGNRTQAAPSRQVTPPPSVRAPGPAAAGAGEDEKVKREDESIKVEQNAKQKKDKSTVKKGLSALGAAPAVNTPVVTPPAGINTP